jgi:hypothetical protein
MGPRAAAKKRRDFAPHAFLATIGEVGITREAAPDILAIIIKRINEKGVLTKQDLLDIVKANR